MQREDMFFKISIGERMAGELFPPADATGRRQAERRPAVVFAHGLLSSKTDSSKSQALLEKFTSAGFAFFRFDFYGRGESEGNFVQTSLTKCIDCVRSAFDIIVSMDGVDTERLCLVGDSFGGLASLVAVAGGLPVRVLALTAPALNFCNTPPEIPEVRFEQTFYEDLRRYDPLGLAEQITCPVLIVHGEADEVVPVDYSRLLAERIPDCALKVLQGTGHRFKGGNAFSTMIGEVVHFITASA